MAIAATRDLNVHCPAPRAVPVPGPALRYAGKDMDQCEDYNALMNTQVASPWWEQNEDQVHLRGIPAA